MRPMTSPVQARLADEELRVAQEQYVRYLEVSNLGRVAWCQDRELMPASRQPVGFAIYPTH